jgi:hypothetical protein
MIGRLLSKSSSSAREASCRKPARCAACSDPVAAPRGRRSAPSLAIAEVAEPSSRRYRSIMRAVPGVLVAHPKASWPRRHKPSGREKRASSNKSLRATSLPAVAVVSAVGEIKESRDSRGELARKPTDQLTEPRSGQRAIRCAGAVVLVRWCRGERRCGCSDDGTRHDCRYNVSPAHDALPPYE